MISRAIAAIAEAMRSNPSCLAAIVLSGFFASLLFWGYQRDADRRANTINILLERCIPLDEKDSKL